MRPSGRRVVHLELHTRDLESACASYALLCGWRPERIESGRSSYLALDMGGGIGGGIVECSSDQPLWLPYVEVADVATTTERARTFGASVLLEPREGHGGWRSVVRVPAGGEVAFWQPRERRR
jgi:predicted enzyme related to lactoylglutathione lyase